MEDFEGRHPLRPLVEGWRSKLTLAKEHKRPWQEIADECMMFFASAQPFLWDKDSKHCLSVVKDGAVSPKFQIQISKAFELVSIFGPMLYWRNPIRTAAPRKPIEVPPELLAAKMGVTPEMIQAVQQQGQNGQAASPQFQFAAQQVQNFQQQLGQIQQVTQHDAMTRQLRADLMERYLNWTPFQLRLHRHAEMAITEALIKGRAVLWPEPYRPPGSSQVMVGSFWDTVDNLFVDPDAESIDEAWWIARERELPTWLVERNYRLPKGILTKAATSESAQSQGERDAHPMSNNHRAMGQTQDLIQVYEIWSRCGAGARLTDVKTDLKDKLDRWAGDHCYLVISPGVPFPLNLSSYGLEHATNEDVGRALRWPTPHWRDAKWPCAVLDFYPAPRSVWPVAPLAPGLGELKALNCFIAHLCNRIWMSSRDFIAIWESVAGQIEKTIKEGKDLSILRIPDDVADDVNKIVTFLQHPPVNLDAWKIVEALLDMFERRTGLSEILYGIQGPQSRTATDANIRQQNVSHRPDHMASKVEEWQTETALREALTVRWWVGAKDVKQLLGETGVALWKEFIEDAPVEQTVFDIDYRIEAASARKPNRDRDVANLHEAMPMWVPMLQGREQMTGDFGPLNWLMEKWGDAVEMDTTGMRTQMPPPQPDDTEQQAALAEQQIEQAKAEAEQNQKQQSHQQSLQQDSEKHQQGMEIRSREAMLKAAIAQATAKAQSQAPSKRSVK